MRFSKIIVASLVATMAISLASASSYRNNGPNTNYGSSSSNHLNQNQFDDNTNDNYVNNNNNNYNNNQQSNYANNNNNNQNYNNQASAPSAAQTYQNNVNNCYGAKQCNRAYPTNQNQDNQYGNSVNNNKSPYGSHKVLPAIYGGNGLFNYKGYARVPERTLGAPRPGYGLSLRPIKTFALSGGNNYQAPSYQVNNHARPNYQQAAPRPIYNQQSHHAPLNHHQYRMQMGNYVKHPSTQYAPRRHPRGMPRRYRPRRAHPRPAGPMMVGRRPTQYQAHGYGYPRPNQNNNHYNRAKVAPRYPRGEQNHYRAPAGNNQSSGSTYGATIRQNSSAKKGVKISGGY